MTPGDRIAAARKELARAREDLTAMLQQDRTRRRGLAMRQLHEIDRMLHPDEPWRSQAGQDRVIDRLLGGRKGGVFVDVGGYDGVTGSNTLYFEEMRGWTGLLVEPVPAMLDRARRRRRCPCLGVAVATSEGEAEFIEISQGFTQMSGLAETYDPALLDRVRADPRHREDVRRVPTRTLSSILTDEGVPHPDFLSLDIEGGEIAVLERFPFERHRITAWSIENNTADPRLPEIMRANGYDLVEFCGPDDIYLKSDA